MKQNVASQVIGAQMCSATDGSAFTGAVTVYVTGDAGVQAVGSVGAGACTHEGQGFHSYAPAQAETNYAHIAFTFIGTGAIPATVQVYTSFPQTGDNFARIGAPAGASISADIAAVKSDTAAVKTKTDFLPSATAGAAGGVFIAGSNAATSITTALTANITGNLSGSVGSVTGAVGSVTGAVGSVTGNVGGNVVGSTASVTGAVGSVTGNVGGNVVGSVASVAAGGITASSIADGAIDRATFAADTGLVSVRSNTAQAGAATTITLDASASAVTDFYKNALIVLTGGTGIGQGRYITAYNGTTKVATVTAWATNPDVTSTFAIIAADALVGATAPTAVQVADEVQTRTIAAVTTVNGLAANTVTAAALAADAGTEIGTAVWASATRLLTAGTNIALAKGTGVTGFTDIDAAGVRAAAGLAAANLDTQLTDIKVYADRTVVRGTVSATAPTTTSFTTSALSPVGVAADQFKGRIIVFDNATTTTALRGQTTDITASSAAANPLFTFTALTTAPQLGDTFSIV